MRYVKNFGRWILVLSFLVVLLNAIAPQKTLAAGLKDFNDLGGQVGADDIANSTTITFKDRGNLDVKITSKLPVFSNASVSTDSIATLFSGNYFDGRAGDNTYRWDFQGGKTVGQGDGGKVTFKAHIIGRNVPDLGATQTEIDNWLKTPGNLELWIGARVALNNSVDNTYYYVVNGDYKWREDNNDGNKGIPVAQKTHDSKWFDVMYYYSEGQIYYVSEPSVAYVQCDSSSSNTIGVHYFQRSACSSGGSIIFDTNWDSLSWDDIKTKFIGDNYTIVNYGTESPGIKVKVAQDKTTSAKNGPTNAALTTASDIELNCSFAPLNPLTWVMCPLVESASHAITLLDTQINNQLSVPLGKDTAFDENGSTGGSALYTAWSVMRGMALALLVIIALIMVISQALSFGPFDAYTVKKVLPRIILAVIGVTLSWQLSKLMIGISNDLGRGVGAVISRPFTQAGLANPKIGGGGESIGAVGAIAGFFSGIDLPVILSFVLVGLAGVLIAFAIIAFRNILIILLVITAPVALVLWILPNTQKAWKFWKDNFTAVLLSFPIIIAFITTGRVFAILTSNLPSQNSSGLFKDIITFIAYFGPYFALPAAFRLAGGAIASIGGIANDRSKGFFDRNKKFRGAQMAKKKAEGQNYSRYSDNNRLGRFGNKVLGGSNFAVKHPLDARRGRGAFRANQQTARVIAGAEILKNDPNAQAHGQDDNFLMALSNEELAIQKLNEDRATYTSETARASDTSLTREQRLEASDKARKAQSSIAAREKGLNAARLVENRKQASVRLAATNALAKTGYQFSSGEKGYGELQDTIRSITGNDEGAYAAAMDEAQYHLKTATRFDLGGINHGAGYDPTAGLDKASLYQLANSKKESITAMNAGLPEYGPLTSDQMEKAAVTYRELQSMRPNATGAAAGEIDKQMAFLQNKGVGTFMESSSGNMEEYIDPTTGTRAIDPTTGNPALRQRLVQVRENYDAVNSPTTGPRAWSAGDISRGWRTTTREENRGDVALAKARTYQPPDPNNMP